MDLKQMAAMVVLTTAAVSAVAALPQTTTPIAKTASQATKAQLNAAIDAIHQHAKEVKKLEEGELQPFLPPGAKVLDAQTGDLTGDGRSGVLVVIYPPCRKPDETLTGSSEMIRDAKAKAYDLRPPRTVLILLRDQNGQLNQVARNDKILPWGPCRSGMDTYGYSQVKPGQFTIVIGNGNIDPQGNDFTFKYDPVQKDWLLVKVERSIYDTTWKKLAPLTPKNFGTVSFKIFDPSTLPKVDMR